MPLPHTARIVLFALLATIGLSSCTFDKATHARIVIGAFKATCPAQMKTEFAKDRNFSALGDAFLTPMSNDTCGCIVERLEKLPPERVVALNGDSVPEKEVEAFVAPCAAVALKPRFGELCMVGAKQGGLDPATADRFCQCMQSEADKMDTAAVETLMNSGEGGYEAMANRCVPTE